MSMDLVERLQDIERGLLENDPIASDLYMAEVIHNAIAAACENERLKAAAIFAERGISVMDALKHVAAEARIDTLERELAEYRKALARISVYVPSLGVNALDAVRNFARRHTTPEAIEAAMNELRAEGLFSDEEAEAAYDRFAAGEPQS